MFITNIKLLTHTTIILKSQNTFIIYLYNILYVTKKKKMLIYYIKQSQPY